MRGRVTYHTNGTQTYEIDGQKVSEAEYNARVTKYPITPGRPPRGQTTTCWPATSAAMAVHPTQIKEAMARNKRHGITGVSYDPGTGDAILADRGARRDLMRLEGLHDRQGGYGDDHATDSPQEPLSEEATGGPVIGQELLDHVGGGKNPNFDPTAKT